MSIEDAFKDLKETYNETVGDDHSESTFEEAERKYKAEFPEIAKEEEPPLDNSTK